MLFNSGTDSLYADALFWSGANSASFPVDPDFTRSANAALDKVIAAILKCDSTLQFDDTNLGTELLDVSLAVASGTAKYAISAAWLTIGRVRVKDPNGNWITLDPVDRRQLSDTDLAATGTPTTYDKMGNFLYLNPTPDYTGATGSIEVQRQRAMDYFVVADTTKAPGFAAPFHRLISLYAALDYVEANSIPNRGDVIRARIGRLPDITEGDPGAGMLKDLAEFYANRDRDTKASFSLQREDYGSAALSDQWNSTPRAFDF
jgi:hypothetical protein